jgi:4-hydroxy-2-oxoheptanedioate aldolase
MRENRVASALRASRPVLSGWLTVGHPLLAEAMAHAGYDAVTVDLQHGAVSDGELIAVLQALSTTDVTPLVRVAWNDPARLMKALDLGAYGVIVPMVEGPDDVRAALRAVRYPPAGVRSYGPTRAAFYGGPDYAAHANEQIVLGVMIETRAALERIDEVLAVPGLDLAFVGPADLSQALGGPPGADWEDGPVPDALERILDASRRHGVPAGIFCKSADYAARMLERGFRFVTADSDVGLLRRGASAALTRLRDR